MARTAKKAPKRRIASRKEQLETLATTEERLPLVTAAMAATVAKRSLDTAQSNRDNAEAVLRELYAERDALNKRISEAEAEQRLCHAACQHAGAILEVRTQSLTGQAYSNLNSKGPPLDFSEVARPSPYPY